jgi:hypothetical protein
MVAGDAEHYPMAFAYWLNVADFAFADEQQLAILYPPASTPDVLLRTANSHFRPNLMIAASEFPPPREAPGLLTGRPLREGMPTAYLCRHFACKLPLNDPEELEKDF